MRLSCIFSLAPPSSSCSNTESFSPSVNKIVHQKYSVLRASINSIEHQTWELWRVSLEYWQINEAKMWYIYLVTLHEYIPNEIMCNYVPRGAFHIQGDHRRIEVMRKDTNWEIIQLNLLNYKCWIQIRYAILFSMQAFKLSEGILFFTVRTNQHPLHAYMIFKIVLLTYRCIKPLTLTLLKGELRGHHSVSS